MNSENDNDNDINDGNDVDKDNQNDNGVADDGTRVINMLVINIMIAYTNIFFGNFIYLMSTCIGCYTDCVCCQAIICMELLCMVILPRN